MGYTGTLKLKVSAVVAVTSHPSRPGFRRRDACDLDRVARQKVWAPTVVTVAVSFAGAAVVLVAVDVVAVREIVLML